MCCIIPLVGMYVCPGVCMFVKKERFWGYISMVTLVTLLTLDTAATLSIKYTVYSIQPHQYFPFI